MPKVVEPPQNPIDANRCAVGIACGAELNKAAQGNPASAILSLAQIDCTCVLVHAFAFVPTALGLPSVT